MRQGLGSPGIDPYGQANERPHHTVSLEPYFIGKVELTQGQWRRLTRLRSSVYDAGFPIRGIPAVTETHPVEQISWDELDHWLPRAGLCLPTEVQWEYAARAGSTSVWSVGNEISALEGAVNVDDWTARRSRAVEKQGRPVPFDDRWAVHAPVGSFRANAFGLHDVHGNVQERCADWYGPYDAPTREGDGLRQSSYQRYKVLRGGAWNTNAIATRSAQRGSTGTDQTSPSIGARVARPIDREAR